jgi:DNA replication factor GINS
MDAGMQESRESKKEVNITYETLYELLRREKSREELQELHQTFFEDVIAYLNEKNQILLNTEEKLDLFSSTEREKTKMQLENIKKILKELYERREKKIINIAINKSRTGSDIIDTSAMLQEEKKLFDSLVEILDNSRINILFKLLNRKSPAVKLEEQQPVEPSETEEKTTIAVRFLKAVPKFVGKELEIYGPFEEEDIARLPKEIADVLIRKGRAEEIED